MRRELETRRPFRGNIIRHHVRRRPDRHGFVQETNELSQCSIRVRVRPPLLASFAVSSGLGIASAAECWCSWAGLDGAARPAAGRPL